MSLISPSLNSYLLQIYRLEQTQGAVQVTHIACSMGVTKPSVCRAVRILAEKNLVYHIPYGPLTLTPKGLAQAAQLWEKQKVIQHFLTEQMGVEESLAEKEALCLVCSLKDIGNQPDNREAVS